jgi:hypothetical protein
LVAKRVPVLVFVNNHFNAFRRNGGQALQAGVRAV